jgi:hypothetical protein
MPSHRHLLPLLHGCATDEERDQHARLQIADVTIQNPVSDEGRRNIDLWTG